MAKCDKERERRKWQKKMDYERPQSATGILHIPQLILPKKHRGALHCKQSNTLDYEELIWLGSSGSASLIPPSSCHGAKKRNIPRAVRSFACANHKIQSDNALVKRKKAANPAVVVSKLPIAHSTREWGM